MLHTAVINLKIMSESVSGLAFIEVQDSNPLKLFKEWQKEVRDAGGLFLQTHSMCLATSTKDGKVSNRTVLLKELNENGFIFVTNKLGRKSQDIEENPCVAATFMWNYTKDRKTIAKQVRIEGKALELSSDKLQTLFDAEKLFCKIRAIICHQGQEIKWEDLKNQHDALLNDVLNNQKVLSMPDYYTGYQIVPERMDFFFTWNANIADRVVFTKMENDWKFVHVAA